MKILHLAITMIFATIFIPNTGVVLAQYGPGFSPVEHYPTVNDTTLELSVINSTEFKQRTVGHNYTLAGIDHNWISKGNNYYDFGVAKVTFFVFGFENGTTKGEVFNLDSQMKIKNIFEYDGDHPPAGYYTDTCMGCPLITGTKPECCGPAYVSPTLDSPLKQFKSGIKPEYVKCNQDLHLIIKAEDGSYACVTIETGKNLAMRGWATTFGTGISTDDYYTKCDTLYPKSNAGVAVLYMPTNSIGKICVRYSNANDVPQPIFGMQLSDPKNSYHTASGIVTWNDLGNNYTIPKGNSTIVYWIKTGNQTGFYSLILSCGGSPFGGIPFAVGYDGNSTMNSSDFPFMGIDHSCPALAYGTEIVGTSGVGVKYIPYP